MSGNTATAVENVQQRARDGIRRLSETAPGQWVVRHRGVVVRLVAVLIGVLLWELYARGQPAYLFPGLEGIANALLEQYRENGLLTALQNSMVTMALGYAIAIVVGIPLGLAMGLNEYLETAINPYLNAMYVSPVSAMVPIFILIGGPTFEVRVFIVFLFCIFEITIDTYEGVETTPQGLLEVADSFGASTWYKIKNVVVPHDLPYITAGLRLGLGRAVQGMILAEVLIEFVNLGGIIRTWSELFRIAGVLSIVLLLMVISIVLTRVIQVVESRIIDWESEVDI